MLRRINCGILVSIVSGAILLPTARPARAQPPAVVAYYPAAPAVTYVPEARGLFGLRSVYRPVAAYPFAQLPTYYGLPAATAGYYPSANVTSYYGAPSAAYYPPLTTTYYYPPANVTSYYSSAPASYYPPATMTYYAPGNVTSYYTPTTPFFTARPPVSEWYAPRPVYPYTVIVP